MLTGELDRVRRLLEAAKAITVLTGAGISTDSGIPDFRGPNGLWTKNPAAERMSDLSHYLNDPEVRRRAWQSRKTHPAWTAEPNTGHLALVDLERSGRLVSLLTQNIDGLHQRAGSSPDLVVELHGTIWAVECMDCGARTRMADQLDRVSDETPDPPCEACGGILKSATISFGQQLNPRVIDRAVRAAQSCDLFLAIGSSLTVHPAAGMCGLAIEAGAPLVVLNAQETPYDDVAEAVLRGPIGEILPALTRDLATTSRSTG
ncbi:MAG TPA: Sir2 family NAD-dependent protein deacetylase [Mycobacteriales bacterium]|nr:Sir2 family NAD-dependent protein deacetylase [Mycobacteriales bacterium]